MSKKVRMVIERISISKDMAEEIAGYLTRFGEKDAYAVRSSATAEDLPAASFAGQQNTYFNIIGKKAILKHINKYLVFPQTAGIMFTADPVTFNRKVVSIDASFGLGEALVSGLVNPDIYKVRKGKVIDKKISTKKLAIYALKDGDTKEKEILPEQ